MFLFGHIRHPQNFYLIVIAMNYDATLAGLFCAVKWFNIDHYGNDTRQAAQEGRPSFIV
ncbi:hypothetical protein SAMN04515618_101632 [Collimonas sp. OK307]|nr:hypothetical protein SAMN04515618_101632 [Collimonas sp. OK307]